MRQLVLTSIAATVLATSGCASIIHGTTQRVGVTSTPSTARVTIDGQSRGTTPMVARLSRKRAHALTVELDGYQPYTATLTRKSSGWVWGNLVFGGLIGLAVDVVGGGMYRLTPNQVQTQLGKPRTVSGSTVTQDGVYVILVTRADTSWQQVGVLQR